MITKDEFREMVEKEYFCTVTPNELVNELYDYQASGKITRLRHRFDKSRGCYNVIFTLVDEGIRLGLNLNHDDFSPDYEEFAKMRWNWVDKAQRIITDKKERKMRGKVNLTRELYQGQEIFIAKGTKCALCGETHGRKFYRTGRVTANKKCVLKALGLKKDYFYHNKEGNRVKYDCFFPGLGM